MPQATLEIFNKSPYTQVIKMDGEVLTQLSTNSNHKCVVESGRHLLSTPPQKTGRRRSNRLERKSQLEIVLADDDIVLLEVSVDRYAHPVLARSSGARKSPDLPSGSMADATVLTVTETHRSTEPIGTETRRINNTSGTGSLTRTIRATQEWNHMISADLHEVNKSSGGIQIGPDWLALRATIEHSLERTYAISVSRRQEFAEEIGVEVAAGADVTIVLAWKRIWQHGRARVLVQGQQVDVPFRLTVGVTFDQTSG